MELPLFKTVHSLNIVVHEGSHGADELEKFVGKFEQLKKIVSKPSPEFDPFKHVDRYIE